MPTLHYVAVGNVRRCGEIGEYLELKYSLFWFLDAAAHNAVPAANMGPPRILGNYVAGRAAQVHNNHGQILGMPAGNRNRPVLGYGAPPGRQNANRNHRGNAPGGNYGNHNRRGNNAAAAQLGNVPARQPAHRYGHLLDGNRGARGRGNTDGNNNRRVATARVKKNDQNAARRVRDIGGNGIEDLRFPGPGQQLGGNEQLPKSPAKARVSTMD